MHAAIAKREPDDSSFVGQVLMRSSPVLTWRPAVVQRLEKEAMDSHPAFADAADLHRVPLESSVRLTRSSRPSKATTRRMVAWPLVAKLVHQTKTDRGARVALRLGSAIAAGLVLGLVALLAIGPLLGRSHASSVAVATIAHAGPSASPAGVVPSSTRAARLHVSGDPIDTLVVDPSTDDANASTPDEAPAPVAEKPAMTEMKHTIAKPKGAPRAKAHPRPQHKKPSRGHR